MTAPEPPDDQQNRPQERSTVDGEPAGAGTPPDGPQPPTEPLAVPVLDVDPRAVAQRLEAMRRAREAGFDTSTRRGRPRGRWRS